MKNKIIFNIYYRFKNFFSVTDLIIIKYLYWLVFFLFTINLHISYNCQVITTSDTKLAFNLNIIYFLQPKKIKKIEVKEYNYFLIKKILKNNIFFYKYKNIKHYDLIQTLDRIKNSGFFSGLKSYIVTYNQKKYLILKLTTNPLLKKIIITDYKKLQIPKKILINIFKNQIGITQNYIEINNSIKTLYFWYKNKGFEWANIQTIQNEQLECLNIKICEGKILRSNLICEQKNIVPEHILCDIENRIKKELGIIPGYILNIKKLELGIINLKDIQLILNCKYKVITTSDGLNVILKYNLLKNHQAHLYKQNTILNKNWITLNIYQMNFNSFTKFLQFLSKKMICSKKILNIFLFYHNNYLLKMISFNKFLRFKYFGQDKNPNQKNFIADIKIMKQFPEISLLYAYPNIELRKNLFAHFIINYYQKLLQVYPLYPLRPKEIARSYKRKNLQSHSKLELKGLKILLKYNVYSHIYLIEEMFRQQNLCKKLCFNIQNYCITTNYKLPISKQKRLLSLKTLNKTIKQHIIALKIQIKYNTFYLTNQLKSGILLFIESSFVFPFNKFNKLDFMINSGQNFQIKYHQVFILPQIIPFFNQNALILLLEVSSYIGEKNHLSILQEDHKQKVNIYFERFYKNSIYSQFLSLSHIEYHLSTHDHYSLYIFCYFIQNLYSTIGIKSFESFYFVKNLYDYGYQSKIGSGIQVNIPIKKIPPLRIEYEISNKKEPLVQLRAYVKNME